MSPSSSLQHLETTLPKDRGYAGTAFPEAVGGFVCPRANAYGGREGIIPPAVAAERGLVPKGLKHVTNADVARTAAEASRDGRTDADRYRAYYGNSPAASLQQEQEEADIRATAEAVQQTQSGLRDPNGRFTKRVPTVTLRPPASRPSLHQTPVPRPTRSMRPSVSTKSAQLSLKHADNGVSDVFSGPNPDTGDDTLDGFYDGLKTAGVRTVATVQPRLDGVEIGAEDGGRAVRIAAGTGPEGAGLRVTAAPQPASEPTGPDLAGVLAAEDPPAAHRELETLRRALDRAHEALVLARADADAQRQTAEKLQNQVDALVRQLKESTPPLSETVRVVLSQEEGRLKLGGRDWECRVVGAWHPSRTGASAVLTVSDARYAAELLSEIRPGPVAVVTAQGRSSCVYVGGCAKIYGDAASADAIACFRFEDVSADNG